MNLVVRDELATDDGTGVGVFVEGVDEVFDGGFTVNDIVGIDGDEGFVVFDELFSAGDGGAVAVGEGRVLGDDGDFGEVQDLFDGFEAVGLALGGDSTLWIGLKK